MSKILVLAPSGFGKTTAIAKINNEKLGINHVGLNPTETFVISATSKDFPFKIKENEYTICDNSKPPVKGNRYITNNGIVIANIIKYIIENRPEIKNVVIDDMNYIMQDNYMQKSLSKGYDIFKEIGYNFYQIFEAMELSNKINFFCLAHYEEYRDSSLDTISYRFKTVGKMVTDYITPEGKFNIVLFGKQYINLETKKIEKVFVTNFDGQYPAKSPIEMFEDTYIPNDFGIVEQAIKNYYQN